MFDFQGYVLKKRADITKSAVLHVQNYAYIDDIDMQRRLAMLEPVRHAVGLGVQAWRLAEGRRLQGGSRGLGRDGGRIAGAWAGVCAAFGHIPMSLRIVPGQKSLFEAYGGDVVDGGAGGVFFGLSPTGCGLPTGALRFMFGRGIGALDNGHVPYRTLMRFGDGLTRGWLGRASKLPESLLHWSRAADITEDRAGLLACRDMSQAILVIMLGEGALDEAEIMVELRRYHAGLDVDWGSRGVADRVRALELFAASDLYIPHGRPIGEVDSEVRGILPVFGG